MGDAFRRQILCLWRHHWLVFGVASEVAHQGVEVQDVGGREQLGVAVLLWRQSAVAVGNQRPGLEVVGHFLRRAVHHGGPHVAGVTCLQVGGVEAAGRAGGGGSGIGLGGAEAQLTVVGCADAGCQPDFHALCCGGGARCGSVVTVLAGRQTRQGRSGCHHHP